MGAKDGEDEKEKEGNGAVAVLGGFSTQLWVQMTISDIFWHHCSAFPSKTATALPALIIGYALRGPRSRKDSTKGRDHGLEKRERGCNSAENIVYLRVACGKRGKGELSNDYRL